MRLLQAAAVVEAAAAEVGGAAASRSHIQTWPSTLLGSMERDGYAGALGRNAAEAAWLARAEVRWAAASFPSSTLVIRYAAWTAVVGEGRAGARGTSCCSAMAKRPAALALCGVRTAPWLAFTASVSCARQQLYTTRHALQLRCSTMSSPTPSEQLAHERRRTQRYAPISPRPRRHRESHHHR